MTYRQLIQPYINDMYLYPPNTADSCKCPLILQPPPEPTIAYEYVCYDQCCEKPCEKPCEKEKKCCCKEEKPKCCCKCEKKPKCCCKKKKKCCCKEEKPKCEKKKCPPEQVCEGYCFQYCPPCSYNNPWSPCSSTDPCRTPWIRGWPWITQSWGNPYANYQQ